MWLHLQFQIKPLMAFDVRRTQHIILEFLWYSVKIPVVLKGDLLWYSIRRTSAFSAPSCIIYLVVTKMLHTINLTFVAQWIMRWFYKSKVSSSTPPGRDFYLFFVVVCFGLFVFLKKTYRKDFAASMY